MSALFSDTRTGALAAIHLAVLLLMPAAFSREGRPASRDILLLAALGIFCTALSHSLFIHGMRKVKAQLAGVIAGLEPVYGVVLAFLLLNEVPSFRTLLGGIAICGAVLLASSRSGKVPSGKNHHG